MVITLLSNYALGLVKNQSSFIHSNDFILEILRHLSWPLFIFILGIIRRYKILQISMRKIDTLVR